MEERIRKLQMMIASETPGEVDEDSEESEVDSDEAWESDGSDEERWGDVFRDLAKGKSKAKKAKGKEVVLKVCSIRISEVQRLIYQPATLMTVDLNETDDEEEEVQPIKKGKGKGKAAVQDIPEEDEEDDEELDVEDLKESEDEFAAERDDAALNSEDDEADEDEDDEEEEDDDEEESEAELPSDSEDDELPDTLEGLDSFVDELDAADRKRRQDLGTKAEITKTKRRVLPVSSGLTSAQAASKFVLITAIAIPALMSRRES
jgi:U3 small nucleolar RNA-associated protein 14